MHWRSAAALIEDMEESIRDFFSADNILILLLSGTYLVSNALTLLILSRLALNHIQL